MREVFRIFLVLGLTSFGGPIAHLAYLRREFVERRHWLDDEGFAQLIAVCQFLPGPASSQLGFAIGLDRAGWRGALAAFAGFTLPSALLMFALAMLAPALAGNAVTGSIVQGLKLVAVAVVAHGLLGMARQLVPDVARAAIAASAVALVLLSGGPWSQLFAVALGALLGLAFCGHVRGPAAIGQRWHVGHSAALVCLLTFAALLALALAVPPSPAPGVAGLLAAFYRTGALVFGGGHVVLPLLQQAVVEPGWLDADAFLTGYGAAQALPGPMFALSAYLGAGINAGLPPAASAGLALGAIFFPGFLLVTATLPGWTRMLARPVAARAVAGINAAVVGLLAAALYDPLWVTAIHGPADLLVAAGAAALLLTGRVAVPWVVLLCVVAAAITGAI
ncbi:chromate efflux transporter [Luteimonas yindakuii]|nr:chromate efflux transporter [Luteimonas yindakuii]